MGEQGAARTSSCLYLIPSPRFACFVGCLVWVLLPFQNLYVMYAELFIELIKMGLCLVRR